MDTNKSLTTKRDELKSSIDKLIADFEKENNRAVAIIFPKDTNENYRLVMAFDRANIPKGMNTKDFIN